MYKKYGVLSPEISCTIPVLDYGQGPEEYYCCYVEVEARNKREAKAIAIKNKEMKDWVNWQRSDNANPFVGLKVTLIED